jgi:hypothetical protein
LDDRAGAGDLIVSGSGSVIVASDELLAQLEGLERLSRELASLAATVAAVNDGISRAWMRSEDAPISALDADHSMDEALWRLRVTAVESSGVTLMLRAAMANYAVNETRSAALATALRERFSYLMGVLSPILLLLALPGLGGAVGTAFLDGFARGRSGREILQEWGTLARTHNGLLNDPATVALLRAAMNGSDDFLAGMLHFSPELIALLGEEGIGATGLSTTAVVAALLARSVGLLKEGPVAVERGSSSPTAAAKSLHDRAERIPQPGADPEDGQIRIERLESPGQPDSFEVYLAGTVDFGLAAEAEPWDMTSNVAEIAGLPAASYSAVLQAMEDAGITAESPVVLTGYSQGGLVAALVASSGDFNVKGLVTFGAPIGVVDIPEGFPVVTVRHTDDLVPAMGGEDANRQAVIVERELFAGRDVPSDTFFPSHGLEYYTETAGLIDDAKSSAVRGALGALDDFTRSAAERGGSVTSTTYAAERIQ